MIIFNFKTKIYYKTSPLVIIGNVNRILLRIKDFGFFENSIFVCSNNSEIRNNKPFIVSKTIPSGWNGEVINEKDFIKTINSKKMNTPSYFNNTIHPIATPYSPTSHGCWQCGGR
jgi:hypothetical protein